MDDKDLISLFRNTIDPVESSPSEDFWKRAFGEIQGKENITYRRQVVKWKGLAYTFGTAMALLLLYVGYVQNKVNTIEKNVVALQELQQKNVTPIPVQGNKMQENILPQQAVSNNTPLAASVNKNDARIAINTYSGNNKTPNKNATQSEVHVNNSIQSNIVADNENVKESPTPKELSAPADSTVSDYAAKNTGMGNSFTHVDSSNDTVQKSDSSSMSVVSSSIKEMDTKNVQKQAVKGRKSFLSGLFIAAFFNPRLNDVVLKDNSLSDNLKASDIKAREDDNFTYSAGIRVGYDITPHWTVLTGGYYQGSSFSIKPTIVDATESNGVVGYSIVTSSGIVNFLDGKPLSKIGDSLKVKGNSSRNYACVPVELRYNFNSGQKLDFYITGGLTALIVAYETTDLHWTSNTLAEGDVTITTVQDLDKLNLGYSLGAGVTYMLWRKISVFAEPDLEGSFTSIDANAPISAYLFNFGVVAGVTYHF